MSVLLLWFVKRLLFCNGLVLLIPKKQGRYLQFSDLSLYLILVLVNTRYLYIPGLEWRAAKGKKKDSTALQQRLRQNDIAEAERKTLLETEQNGAAGTPHKHKKKETGFTGQIGFVMAAAGSAVGVGNLWRFPYLAAKDGGGLFIVIYMILALTFGFTLLTSDIAIGRKTGMNSIRAYEAMSPKWKFLGIPTTLS